MSIKKNDTHTYLAPKGDEDGEELSFVPDDHAVRDARKLRLELVLKNIQQKKTSIENGRAKTAQTYKYIQSVRLVRSA